MPTYEYECQKCGHRFEVFQSIKEQPKRKCVRPRCNGRVRRLLGAGAGMIFKGSGFYITDYRKPGYKEAAKKNQPSGNGSSGNSGSTSATTQGGDKKSK